MLREIRGGFFLFVSAVFFLIFAGVLALGMVMRPGRWSERL